MNINYEYNADYTGTTYIYIRSCRTNDIAEYPTEGIIYNHSSISYGYKLLRFPRLWHFSGQ
jgi:hypothetical protein